ncbi:helix-turn-helix transcriptional regulator [Pantoea sp. CCBC3-3-1]|uniref:helix-turn-helix transcriptional regulator n=1 Tax=Pantoea sp. CCBC3-3-1 TaxID=2490851 RepID=UPI0011BEDAA6|nr:helix-turn-helix transcriptional regulator [Pantoea sp. CCBC3-3-1]
MVPKRLKAARLEKGFTQEKLGQLVGIDESTARSRISQYESGTYRPDFDTACRMAKVLDVPECYLFVLDDGFAAAVLEMYHQLKGD